MNAVLESKLHEYLTQNNPDILIAFNNDEQVTKYLKEKVASFDDRLKELQKEGKPAYIVEEICLDELTKEFRPSRYNYLLSLLEEDFRSEYLQWQDSGILTYEVINLLGSCTPIFDALAFSEDNEDDRQIRYAIIRTIQLHLVGAAVDRDYLEKIDFSAEA